MYKDKKIFVLGLARSGSAVCKLLIADAAHITVVDGNENDENIEDLKRLGVNVIIAPVDKQADYLDESFDLVVKNPGISPFVKTIEKAGILNIPVTNEVEVAFNYLPKNVDIIGITGSNGKTTTTTITYEILKQAGKNAVLAGNIGIPLSDMVKTIKEEDILVMEISCQQLNDFKDFKANISVLTNLNESHTDFFKTHERYLEVKQKIFNNQTENDLAIINASDKKVLKLSENILPKKITFSTKEKCNLYLENNTIYYNNEEIIKTEDIKLVGNHNYENIMVAIAIVKKYNVENNIIKEFLNSFTGVEHRNQYIKTINGRKFYNDSKSTNVTATQIALASFTNPTILLLGGLDRNHSFEELKPFMKNVKQIVAYGETKERIKTFAKELNIKCDIFNTLKESVIKAYENSSEGDIILLSPACASWDQYKDFEKRGEDFINIVNEIN